MRKPVDEHHAATNYNITESKCRPWWNMPASGHTISWHVRTPCCTHLMLQDFAASACLRWRNEEAAVQCACKVSILWGCSSRPETAGIRLRSNSSAGTKRICTHLFISVPLSLWASLTHARARSPNLKMPPGAALGVFISFCRTALWVLHMLRSLWVLMRQ